MDNLIDVIVLYAPRIVGAFGLVVLAVVLAVLAGRFTPFVLRRLRFDRICERAGVTSLMREGGIRRSPRQLASLVVFYAVLALAIVTAMGSI